MITMIERLWQNIKSRCPMLVYWCYWLDIWFRISTFVVVRSVGRFAFGGWVGDGVIVVVRVLCLYWWVGVVMLCQPVLRSPHPWISLMFVACRCWTWMGHLAQRVVVAFASLLLLWFRVIWGKTILVASTFSDVLLHCKFSGIWY